MASGQLIYFGLTMLLLVPVFMGFVGATFGETITNKENQNIDDNSYANVDFAEPTSWWDNIKAFFTPDPLGWIGQTFLGYSLLPWWVNLFLIVIPLILLIRGLVSASA